jgi:isopenicillin N synthase-like dioxygenase
VSNSRSSRDSADVRCLQNDLFVSTLHRAINRTGVERYSIPVFVGTSYDTIIDTIPSCITPDRPKRYEPVKAGDFVRDKVAAGLVKY